MSRISLSRKEAQLLRCYADRAFSSGVTRYPDEARAVERLSAAFASRPKKPERRERERKQAQKKATKRERRASVREWVMNRADLVCECGCGRWFRGFMGGAQLDHFFGVAREESGQSCWALRADCHQAKTLNQPSREVWLTRFLAHCLRHGYGREAAKVRAELDSMVLLSRASAEAGKGGGL